MLPLAFGYGAAYIDRATISFASLQRGPTTMAFPSSKSIAITRCETRWRRRWPLSQMKGAK